MPIYIRTHMVYKTSMCVCASWGCILLLYKVYKTQFTCVNTPQRMCVFCYPILCVGVQTWSIDGMWGACVVACQHRWRLLLLAAVAAAGGGGGQGLHIKRDVCTFVLFSPISTLFFIRAAVPLGEPARVRNRSYTSHARSHSRSPPSSCLPLFHIYARTFSIARQRRPLSIALTFRTKKSPRIVLIYHDSLWTFLVAAAAGAGYGTFGRGGGPLANPPQGVAGNTPIHTYTHVQFTYVNKERAQPNVHAHILNHVFFRCWIMGCIE